VTTSPTANGWGRDSILAFAKAVRLRYTFIMQKTLDIKLTGSEASRIAAAIDKCDASLREIFRRMKKDQTEIERLKAHTQKILADIKADMKSA
jgi:hypothetical protein